MPEPEPLSLILEFARAVDAGDPYSFRFEPQNYLLRSAGGAYETVYFAWDQALLADLEAMRRPVRDAAALQRLGDIMRGFLRPAGWQQHEALILALGSERRLLLTIRSAAAELYALPWELLTLKATGQHVGELSGVLLRYEWPGTQTVPAQRASSLDRSRILFAWSAAGGAVPAREHLNAIQQASTDSGRSFHPDQDVLPNVSCGGLVRALDSAQNSDRPVEVLHLLCHGTGTGTTFGLALDGETPGEDAVADAGRLRLLLAPYAGTIRLVVLAACDGANSGNVGNQLGSVAQCLHRAGFAAVVASRYPLSASGSIQMTSALYQGLSRTTNSLEDALLAVRRSLALDPSRLEWASIQIYARSADGPRAEDIATVRAEILAINNEITTKKNSGIPLRASATPTKKRRRLLWGTMTGVLALAITTIAMYRYWSKPLLTITSMQDEVDFTAWVPYVDSGPPVSIVHRTFTVSVKTRDADQIYQDRTSTNGPRLDCDMLSGHASFKEVFGVDNPLPTRAHVCVFTSSSDAFHSGPTSFSYRTTYYNSFGFDRIPCKDCDLGKHLFYPVEHYQLTIHFPPNRPYKTIRLSLTKPGETTSKAEQDFTNPNRETEFHFMRNKIPAGTRIIFLIELTSPR